MLEMKLIKATKTVKNKPKPTISYPNHDPFQTERGHCQLLYLGQC